MLDPDPAGSKALGSGLVPDPAGSKNSGFGAPLVKTDTNPSGSRYLGNSKNFSILNEIVHGQNDFSHAPKSTL